MEVLAIDPGGVTGLAHLSSPDEKNFTFYTGAILRKNHHKFLWEFLDLHYQLHGDLIIVFETFDYRVITNDQGHAYQGLSLISCEYIGVIKLFCAHYDIPFVTQSPALAMGDKVLWTEAKLKAYGFHTKGSKSTNGAPDINSAMRHLLTYVTTNKQVSRNLRNSVLRSSSNIQDNYKRMNAIYPALFGVSTK